MSTLNEIIRAEFDSLMERIKTNMQDNGINASGKTAQSLVVEQSDDGSKVVTTLFGREDFDNIEKGTSPEMARKYNAGEFYFIIKQWAKDKGLEDLNPYWAAKNIQEFGSLLFRNGGRSDIYTPEITQSDELLMRRLDEYGRIIISEKTRI